MCVSVSECTWAEHGLNLVNELFSHEVSEASHAHHSAVPLAGDALQTLILLQLVEHVSDTDGTHIHAGIAAHKQKGQCQTLTFSTKH